MIKKNFIINESQFEILVKHLSENKKQTDEGIFDPVKNIYHGLKGVWRGEGYDYFKYLSELRNLTKKLKKLDEPNHKIMTQLTSLRDKVTSSKMPTEKKDNLLNAINSAMSHFNSYSDLINQIETLASQKLN